MAEISKPAEKLLEALQERAKELNCLYEIEELLRDQNASLASIFIGITRALPMGFQYPDYCFVRIKFDGAYYGSTTHKNTPWVIKSPLELQDKTVGYLEVYYSEQMPEISKRNPFLPEEKRLAKTVGDRISHFLLHRHLRDIIQDWDTARDRLSSKGEWRVVVDMLRKTDQELYLRVARKMLNHLCWNGIHEADEILEGLGSSDDAFHETTGNNEPRQKRTGYDILKKSKRIFSIAHENIRDIEILELVQKWMQEDRASFLIRTLINLESSLSDISEAVRRFHHLSLDNIDLADSTRKGVKVALVRRFLSDQLEFIQIAKDYVEIRDFIDLIPRLIHPVNSHGKIGGKSAGLFLASRILKKAKEEFPELSDVRIPNTFYITSDGLHAFLAYNNLEDVTEQKYKQVEQVRQEHSHIIHLFKSSHFPPEIIQGLSMALDEFGDSPLIVRSSSLLEDRLGAAFSGKYTSLFVANQGTKRERLEALLDAIAEVYSSIFHSDPIQYRSERGLLDFHEEMGILIQEVVGNRVGKYFLPSFAGVAFSNNEFRWSPRIRREDGLIRLVPGLGTRAVDRLSDDYSILVAPGQPGLKVNATVEETARYAPRYMDVIDLETNKFATISADEFTKVNGAELPGMAKIYSIIDEDRLKEPSLFGTDFEKDDIVVTFDGLIHKSPFVKQVKTIMEVLQEHLNVPVDIEFASDGHHFHLLQCRPQSHTVDSVATPIPKDIPEEAIVFSANRYVSNGRVPDITHVVYVDPQKYSEIEELKDMKQIGRVVGHLNKVLPKRQFILMGPGRWGSRGDIKLGVNVTYSDINNTAMLIEIARQKGNYVPDLSFGTHFFQDLVEASIRYLPLYPDDSEVIFNEHFLARTHNILPEIAPEYAHLAENVHVIDVPRSMRGKIMRVYMNADLDEAVAVLTQPSAVREKIVAPERSTDTFSISQTASVQSEDHWRWRSRMVDRIAAQIDPDLYGIKAMYVFGSTKNGTAGAGSDIDILLHVTDDKIRRKQLLTWLDGWSSALDEMNFLRTGYRAGGLLDVHLVTDDDIERQTSYAAKIGAITDAAKEVPIRPVE